MKTRMKISDVHTVGLLFLFAGVCSFLCWAIADIVRLEQEISVSNEDVSQLIVKHRLWEKGEKVIFWPKGPRLKHEEGDRPGILREFMQHFLHEGDDHRWPRSSSRSSSQRDQQRNPGVGNLLGNPSARQEQTGGAFQSETRQVANKPQHVPIWVPIAIASDEDMPDSPLTYSEVWIRDAQSDQYEKMIRIPDLVEVRASQRREKVKEAMASAWEAYKQYAWGFDELDLMNLKGSNNHGGLGVTIIDSLDTLYIMGLDDQFNEGAEWVATSLDFSTVRPLTVSETSARVLGGLLSAYDLSGRRLFLKKAQELANRLFPAWQTGMCIPILNYIDLASGGASGKTNHRYSRACSRKAIATGQASIGILNRTLCSATDSSTLADIPPGLIEFFALSLRTSPVVDVTGRMFKTFPADGLLPTCISPHSGKPTCSKVTFGEDGGRFYDSLLKLGMLTRSLPVAKVSRGMWEQSMEDLLSSVRKSTPSSYAYIAERLDTDFPTILPKIDEGACFAPGMLALGADDASPELATQYMQTAEELAQTCYSYYRSPPGVSHSREVTPRNLLDKDGLDMTVGSYLLESFATETIESYFHLWRKTGDEKYRHWAWNAFGTSQRYLDSFQLLGKMPSPKLRRIALYTDSSFMANTLKYMYLLYSPPSVMSRNEWIFTTGAHPIKREHALTTGEITAKFFTFTWKINNFSKRTHSKYYVSSTFGATVYIWRMELYPKGNNVPYLSVYLGISDAASLDRILADVEIVIVDQSDPNRSAKKHAFHKFVKGGHFDGFGTILSLEDLHNPTFGYLVNDTLIVEVRFLKRCGLGHRCKG